MKTILFQLILSSIFISTACVESNSQATGSSNSSEMKWSVIHAGNQCGVEDAKQTIVKTQEEFDDLWQLCFQNMPAPIAKPTIDFSKEWVVGYFQGTTNQGGHSLIVDSVAATDKGAKVALTHIKPGKNCASTMSIEFPYVLIRVEHFRPDKAEYNVTEKVVDCN